MKQLTEKLKNGELRVLDVPFPTVGRGLILVQNHFSLISAGTEGGTVTAARKNLLGKAKERPQQVKQALDVLLQQGPVQAYRAVMKKLDVWSPLGYSSAGRVIEIATDVSGIAIGDLVACAGVGYANHAEIVAIPVNLCVKLSPDANLKFAAYNTLGSIAMQGVRQADLRLGESCAVIGLGLIGQLTCLILQAAGIRVVGIDVNPYMVDMASQHCVEKAFCRDETNLAETIDAFSEGIGMDAVIITAATNSTDPVNFAGRIARKKGKVVIVGNVPTGFDRDPYYYRKELEMRMSCSYGPGRYDPAYEEKGIDYPPAYVRWTEKRNMEAFQQLVYSGRIKIDYLTTHIFDFEKAPDAYDLILTRSEPFLGILIKYNIESDPLSGKIELKPMAAPGKINIAFIGAGSYAQSHLVPNIPKSKDIVLKGVISSTGTSSRSVAERFGFQYCTAEETDIFQDDSINMIFIATRHNTHAAYVLKALKASKHVFVEKPLCLSEDELAEIKDEYTGRSSVLMVGFNRRFAPLIVFLKEKMDEGPMAMTYRINAGVIPPESWIQDKDIGGGRIIGEVCHFVDLLSFITGSLPIEVFASSIPDTSNLHDTVAIQLRFGNGSIGQIAYFANGSKSLPKEYIEVYKSGTTAVIKDFKELEIYGSGYPLRKKLMTQDKGQKMMVQALIEAIKAGKASPISFAEIHANTLATFKIIESLRTRRVVGLKH